MLSQDSTPLPDPPVSPGAFPAAAGPPLAIARYRITASFERDWQLPAYAGPLLRSVLGLALRQGACVTGAPVCKGCPLLNTCAYPTLFETPPRQTRLPQKLSEVPHPYIIEPPPMGTRRVAAGQPLAWHLVLVGSDSLGRLPLLVQSWQRALRAGLGPQRVRGQLVALEVLDVHGAAQPAFDLVSGRTLQHMPVLPWPTPRAACSELHLQFHSPLRLQREGRPLSPDELSPRALVAHMLRRCGLMLELHLGVSPPPFDVHSLVALAATLTDDRHGLQWHDEHRYSTRQQRSAPLGGVLGRWTLRGELTPLVPWFELCRWLHLGKAAVMGLGGYQLQAGGAP